jgi:4-hydroxy-tetrahydrodipicolinate reductase
MRAADELRRMSKIRIAVAGAAGRMGRTLIRAVLEDERFVLSGALEAAGHPDLGIDAGLLAGTKAMGVGLTQEASAVMAAADALLDFTTPDVSIALASLSAQRGLVHVMGTTGFSGDDEAQIRAAARRTVIVKSGNMSLGVNLLAALVKRAASALPDFDIEIIEMHHRMKTDAPSGTALLLGRAAADGRGPEAESQMANVERSGARSDGAIGFASLRGGTVVGEHQVIFAGPYERVVLGHVAEDRMIFARGALAAAAWGQTRKPGFYAMSDVLGLAE